MTKEELVPIFRLLGLMHRAPETKEEVTLWLTEAYWEVGSFPADEIERAAREWMKQPGCQHCKRGPAFPLPAELRRMIPQMVQDEVARQARQQRECCESCDGQGWVLARSGGGVERCGCLGGKRNTGGKR